MKMMIVIVHNQDASDLAEQLRSTGHMFTKLSTTGGFLRSGNTTLIVGTEDQEVSTVLDLIHRCCKSRKQMAPAYNMLSGDMALNLTPAYEVTVGGATVFVLDVEQFHKF
ncbi:MAG: cyclic-di-AMP receptor [Lachnospiraceae bacterium]|nr:cyclic-di-AMP receptor [Lachnospiraceae bacterium]